MLQINPFKAELPRFLSRIAQPWLHDLDRVQDGLSIREIKDPAMIVVTRDKPGLTVGQITALNSLIHNIEVERSSKLQYLVFELSGGSSTGPNNDLGDLLRNVSDLILKQPVVTVGWARGLISGVDLELAMACSVLIAQSEARFSFELDLVTSQRTYATLARKIGFVRAERLMEQGIELTSQQMEELFLVKQLPINTDSFAELSKLLQSRARRHNAACGIYRAQRLAAMGP